MLARCLPCDTRSSGRRKRRPRIATTPVIEVPATGGRSGRRNRRPRIATAAQPRSTQRPYSHEIADVVAGFVATGGRVTIYDATGVPGTDLARRVRSIQALVADAAAARQSASLIFDSDSTLRSFDRQHLIEASRVADAREFVTYDHVPFAGDLALTLPDVVAWCWARGGDRRRRIGSIVAEVRTL